MTADDPAPPARPARGPGPAGEKTASESASESTRALTRDVAREHEPERYLAATLAAEPARSALIALAAYQSDLSRIVAGATQPLMGEIRLQWWRDSLAAMTTGARVGSPLADAVGAAVTAFRLPLPLLTAMSEARAFDLYDDPMPDQAALDGFLSQSEALSFELAARVVGIAAGDAGALASAAGRAFGMTRLLVRLPSDCAAGRILLPGAMLAAYGVTRETLLAGQVSPEVRALVAGLSAAIASDLATLGPRLRALPRAQRVAFLPLAVISPHLRLISRPSHDPLRDIARLTPLARVWRIGRAHMLHVY